jgi:hypothetical protein
MARVAFVITKFEKVFKYLQGLSDEDLEEVHTVLYAIVRENWQFRQTKSSRRYEEMERVVADQITDRRYEGKKSVVVGKRRKVK